MVYKCINFILSTLYPGNCLLCGSKCGEKQYICPDCLHELPHNRNSCYQCALPLTTTTHQPALCGLCQKHAPVYDRILSPFHYDAPIDHLISRFKFNGKLHTGRLLSSLLGDFIGQQQIKLPELIVPVPLHSTRLRKRGYNQSLELARPLSRRFNIPLDYACCRRIKPTASQSDLERSERRRNIRGAFEVTTDLKGAHIVLIDDVVTTGSTVSELAREFIRAGVKRVDVWAVARTC